MKKLFALSLIIVFAVSSASLGAVTKTKTKTTTMTVTKAAPVAAAPAGSGTTIAPKLCMVTGDYNGIAIGVESYFYSVSGFQLGAEGYYKPASNNVSSMQFGGIGRYMIPMESSAFQPYVGGGLNYNLYTVNLQGAGSASGIGFKLFSGADFPIAGLGVLYGTIGYGSNSFNSSYSYNVPGGGTVSGTYTINGSGIYLEGGYRFSL